MTAQTSWTEEQRAALAREYARIGARPGERWPAPSQHHAPDELLEILRSVPAGAGVDGYMHVLRTRNG